MWRGSWMVRLSALRLPSFLRRQNAFVALFAWLGAQRRAARTVRHCERNEVERSNPAHIVSAESRVRGNEWKIQTPLVTAKAGGRRAHVFARPSNRANSLRQFPKPVQAPICLAATGPRAPAAFVGAMPERAEQIGIARAEPDRGAFVAAMPATLRASASRDSVICAM